MEREGGCKRESQKGGGGSGERGGMEERKTERRRRKWGEKEEEQEEVGGVRERSGKREREEEGRGERKRGGDRGGNVERWSAEGGGGEISREVVRTETDNILVRVDSQLQHSAVYSPQRDTEGPKFWDSLLTWYFTTKQTRRQCSDGSVDTERTNNVVWCFPVCVIVTRQSTCIPYTTTHLTLSQS